MASIDLGIRTAGTALSLMYLGGLFILQAASVVVKLPIVGVWLMMMLSFMKTYEHDRPQ